MIDLTAHLGTIRATARDWFRRTPAARWHMDIEDAEQSAFLIAYEADESFDGKRGGYAAWMVRKVRWGLSDLLERSTRQRRHGHLEAYRAVRPMIERTPLQREQDAASVRMAFDTLPAWLVDILTGRQTVLATAKGLGKATGTVQYHIGRELDRFREAA